MNRAEQKHKAIMKIIMKGFHYKLTPAERSELATLTGYYRGGKGRPPKNEQATPRITDADFDTPEAFKKLAEKIINKPIWCMPGWKKHRPRGSKSPKVAARHAERYQSEVATYKEDTKGFTLQLCENATGISYPNNPTENEIAAYDSTVRTFRRDLAKGHEAEMNNESQKEQIAGIAASLQNILNKHSK